MLIIITNNLIFDNLIGMINDLIILNLIALKRKELTSNNFMTQKLC